MSFRVSPGVGKNPWASGLLPALVKHIHELTGQWNLAGLMGLWGPRVHTPVTGLVGLLANPIFAVDDVGPLGIGNFLFTASRVEKEGVTHELFVVHDAEQLLEVLLGVWLWNFLLD